MATLSLIEFLTLDGVMQGFGSADEDRSGGFEHGGWGPPYADPVLTQNAGRGLATPCAYLFGRRTYERMAAHWPHEPDSNPVAASLNSAPKYVVSATLERVDWRGTTVLRGNPRQSVAELRRQSPLPLVVLGSGELAQTLLDAELVDELNVFIHPLLLGSGRRLFGATQRPQRLTLLDCTPTTTGVLLVRYAVMAQ